MNTRFKSMLHKAWNEPRHFFFWLAMFSFAGFAAILMVGLTQFPIDDSAAWPPAPAMTLGALGCICSLMASSVAFILAWIPPVRRLFSWLLHRRSFVLVSMLTLVALFYAVENWRGRRAWQDFKREGEARGERFDVAGIVPAPVPNDQNFFETPLWEDLHFVQTNTITRFDVFGPKPNNSPGIVTMAKAQHVDLIAWQAFYRGKNNLVSLKGGLPTNYFPIAKEPQAPAVDVLRALSKFEENRQLLLAASARPLARFWINYDAGPAMPLPHLAHMKASALFLSLHSTAALQAGDRATALEDVRILLRLIESIRGEPILISHLVRLAMLHFVLQPVWEGLADRLWTEAELNFIESELGKLNFPADYHFAMRGERAFSLWAIDYIRKARHQGRTERDAMLLVWSEGGPGFQEVFGEALHRLQHADGAGLFRLIPAGWFDQNKLSLCRAHANHLLPLVDQERRVVPPAAVKQLEPVIEERGRRPYDVFSAHALRVLQKEPAHFARAQAFVDLARLACALERYRLANGHYPEALDPLSPTFIDKLPHDVIDGQPLKYRRRDEGDFVLYSVGWNETDDGGKVELTKLGNVAWNEGDWVWRYPAK